MNIGRRQSHNEGEYAQGCATGREELSPTIPACPGSVGDYITGTRFPRRTRQHARVSAPLRLSSADARRFHRRAVLLDAPAPGVGEALAHHGFIQIDPINVCGRMHDLILRNRVAGYREGGLMEYVHGPASSPLPAEQRTAFEHHLPHSSVLAVMGLEAWPYLLAAMRRRTTGDSSWSGKLDARQRPLAKAILAELAARGPLSSDDIDDGNQRDHQGWGAHASLAKTTLHKLFFHGQVLIARREGQRRLYDLPERVLPAATLAAPEPSAEITARWITLLKLRQLRLVALARKDVPLVADLVQQIEVEGCPPLYCLREDLPLLEAPLMEDAPKLLAPLDPLIYDRKVTRQLWGYDYTWEVYTPAAKRLRGYYALPVLNGSELVGHIDPKADRQSKKLVVVNRSIRRGYKASTAVKELAAFLGLR
ncbi:MAG: hypothetical protein JWO89_2898 [Verrucomicrobiaceae bacterium]|nr:hypothetical protein [Verrucomicrobiaceae bacterium]